MKHYVLLIFAALLVSKTSNAQNTNKAKPNILLICVDDLRNNLGAYGDTQAITPNIDALAKQGVIFRNHQVQYAVCGPSRAALTTGLMPEETGVIGFKPIRRKLPDVTFLPEYFKNNGYITAAAGKIHDPRTVGNQKNKSKDGDDVASWSIPYLAPKGGHKAKNMALDFQDLPEEKYVDGIIRVKGIKLLEKVAKEDKPFFMAIGFKKPHEPFIAPKKYWDLYDRDKIDLAPFQQLADGTPKLAYHSFGEIRAFSDIDSKLKIGDKIPEAKQRELIHGYMACISYIDAQIGKLLDDLERRSILDNTLIVLWGDHGFHLGDHTEWCKHSNFEQATRIPFMFAGPGVAKNQKSSHPVNLVDLFPTIFDLAGVQQHPQTDGKSLVNLLDANPSTNIEMDYAYHQYKRGSRMGYSIRTDRYRYTEWHGDNYRSYKNYKGENIVGRELYDYKNDPLETKNFVKDASYKTVVNDLKSKLKAHLTK